MGRWVFGIGMLVALVVLPLWGALDANNRPQGQWDTVGQNPTVWVIVLFGGMFFVPVGMIAAIVYFTTVRPKLARAGHLEGKDLSAGKPPASGA